MSKSGEVYNLGGGRDNSISILETISLLADMGFHLKHRYEETNRIGDHICYISDLTKLRRDFPGWKLEYDLPKIVLEIVEHQMLRKEASQDYESCLSSLSG